MKPDKMTLYICPNCNILLMTVDKRLMTYERSTLKKNGYYEGWEQDEPYLDVYVCPSCGLTTISDTFSDGNEGQTLSSIVIPIVQAEKLIEIWDIDYRNIYEASNSEYEYGIPLTDKKLKRLLTKELL